MLAAKYFINFNLEGLFKIRIIIRKQNMFKNNEMNVYINKNKGIIQKRKVKL